MNINSIERIKRLALISVFSDDYLMSHLVLKGGNAINLVYRLHGRSSIDIDLSMDGEFAQEELLDIKDRFSKALEETFKSEQLHVFDIKFEEKPPSISDDMKEFWGGYGLTFKVTSLELAKKHSENINLLRTTALPVAGEKKVFKIDISRHEFCGPKHTELYEDYDIPVYLVDMIVIEKLRTLCQKMKEYESIAKYKNRRNSGRAKDFYDIYILSEEAAVNLTTDENKVLLRKSFEAKRVPLSLLRKLPDYKEQHKLDFPALQQTVSADVELKDFDFYFNYVLALIQELEPLGNE